MFLLCGLGNMGAEYAQNRHNIGFMAVDKIAQNLNAPPFKIKYQGEYAETNFKGTKIILLKPQTFMNLSGRSVAPCVNFYKIPLQNVFVFHDELDLPLEGLRIKIGGGSGGHNGIKSLDECLGDPNYTRVRMGIGHPGHKDRVHGYVLGNFSSEERTKVDEQIERVVKHIPLLLEHKLNDFMRSVKPPAKPKIEMKAEE